MIATYANTSVSLAKCRDRNLTQFKRGRTKIALTGGPLFLVARARATWPRVPPRSPVGMDGELHSGTIPHEIVGDDISRGKHLSEV